MLTDTYLDLLERRDARVVVPVLCPTCFLKDKPFPKQRGVVKWFSPRRGYGFVIIDSGEEAFFHQEQLLEHSDQTLRQGQTVRFHLHYPPKGPEALNVELVEA
jgi:CspA family cold shock protein